MTSKEILYSTRFAAFAKHKQEMDQKEEIWAVRMYYIYLIAYERSLGKSKSSALSKNSLLACLESNNITCPLLS